MTAGEPARICCFGVCNFVCEPILDRCYILLLPRGLYDRGGEVSLSSGISFSHINFRFDPAVIQTAGASNKLCRFEEHNAVRDPRLDRCYILIPPAVCMTAGGKSF